MDKATQRVWAEIDVQNLKFNYHQAKKQCMDAAVMPVIKANAYGHGSVALAKILTEEGADCFAVAAPCEALELRTNGIAHDILILGAVPSKNVEQLLQHNISLAVSDFETAQRYNAEVQTGTLRVHIKLDTGMSRYGIQVSNGVQQTVGEIKQILSLPNLLVEGLFTHFSVADSNSGSDFTKLQMERFEMVRSSLDAEGIKFRFYHCANSAAIIRYPACHYNMVREGIMLYGTLPDADMQGELELRPVMSLKTVVEQIKTLKAGESIGYGRTYVCETDCKIAILSIGYADGLFRNGSGEYEMLLHGRRVKQVGRVCMDICMVDVTELANVQVGDVVTVFGRDKDEFIPIEEYAKAAGTFNYEALCAVSARVPRFYV